ncbi:hypothetical protein [Actinoplanes flavus]|uniref:Uncharacterized protein n=1 Tax=Actinoplanes flavus TaxID=2820290 RepID=A0ABS3UVU8_9ACTN|nr:hypothetical protein [Actinoplanes flavus]MBO3742699.1 hypothetical protein [Actinoplanes flavus]
MLDQVLSGPLPQARIRVLQGENSEDGRRGDKQIVAISMCTYTCPDFATLDACVDALKASDDKLRARPDAMMLWDWQDSDVVFDTPENPRAAGGTVRLGVAWYDKEFFLERGDAGFSRMHKVIYDQIGVPQDRITIEHFLAADQAVFTGLDNVPSSPGALTAGAAL